MFSQDLESLVERASDIFKNEQQSNKPVIAVWGMMNAGKSYLLNMLTDHYSSEYFPTNDIRETAELRFFEGDSHIFLDTPGLDASEEDDLVALHGATKADFVLFVHQPRGELEKIELEFLMQLKDSFGVQAENNIVLIISKADSEISEKIEEIEQKVLEQFKLYLGFSPISFQVSGTRFHKGVQQCKDGLIKASHIEDLKKHIDALTVDVMSVRREKKLQALNVLLSDISVIEHSLESEKRQLFDELTGKFSSFVHNMLSFRTNMVLKKAEYLQAKLQGE